MLNLVFGGDDKLAQFRTSPCLAARMVADEPAAGVERERVGGIAFEHEGKGLARDRPMAGLREAVGNSKCGLPTQIGRQPLEHAVELAEQLVRSADGLQVCLG